MKARLTYRAEDGYLHVKVRGQNTAENVGAYLAEVRTACVERSYKAVLIEENLDGPGLPLLKVFELASKGSEDVWRLSLKIAFVDVNPEHDPDNVRFAETVALNRGVNVKVFFDVEQARQWLVSELGTEGGRK